MKAKDSEAELLAWFGGQHYLEWVLTGLHAKVVLDPCFP